MIPEQAKTFPDELARALEYLRGPAELARTYVLTREPDGHGAEGLLEVLLPLDTPLAELLEAAARPADHEAFSECHVCSGTAVYHFNGLEVEHASDCALIAVVRAINGGKP
jgi:hypothetical protein